MLQCTGVNTHGLTEREHSNGDIDDSPLAGGQESKLRRVIAVLNYVAQDRPGVGCAVKEVARDMASPTKTTEAKVKRLARYLKGQPREVSVRVQSDSDWAGCRRTRRWTRGGANFLGCHLVKYWSETQTYVTLSSAEPSWWPWSSPRRRSWDFEA